MPFQMSYSSKSPWTNVALVWLNILMDKIDVLLHVITATEYFFANGTWLTLDWPVVPVNIFIMAFHC